MSRTRLTAITINIRKYAESDNEKIVTILKINKQYNNPNVEGLTAMINFSKFPGSVFLIAEINGDVVGTIRGIYDGSRAQIHLISVLPTFQNCGIGKKLVQEIASQFKNLGAKSISVTATKNKKNQNGLSFFNKFGFEELPVVVALNKDIDTIINNAD